MQLELVEDKIGRERRPERQFVIHFYERRVVGIERLGASELPSANALFFVCHGMEATTPFASAISHIRPSARSTIDLARLR